MSLKVDHVSGHRVSSNSAPVIKIAPKREEKLNEYHVESQSAQKVIKSEKSIRTESIEDLLNEASRDATTTTVTAPTSFASSSNETRYYSHSSNNDRSLPRVDSDLLDINRQDSQDEDQLCVELFGPPNFEQELEDVEADAEFKKPEVPKREQPPTVSVLFRNSSSSENGSRRLEESVRFSKASSVSSTSDEEPPQQKSPVRREESVQSETSSRDQSVDEASTTGGQMSERDMMKLFNTPIPTTEGGLYFK